MHSGEANALTWPENRGAFERVNLLPALTALSYNPNNQQTLFVANILTHDLNRNPATRTDGDTHLPGTEKIKGSGVLSDEPPPGAAVVFAPVLQ